MAAQVVRGHHAEHTDRRERACFRPSQSVFAVAAVVYDLAVPSTGQVEIAHENVARIHRAISLIPIALSPSLVAIVSAHIVIRLSVAGIGTGTTTEGQCVVIAVALVASAGPRVVVGPMVSRIAEIASMTRLAPPRIAAVILSLARIVTPAWVVKHWRLLRL